MPPELVVVIPPDRLKVGSPVTVMAFVIARPGALRLVTLVLSTPGQRSVVGSAPAFVRARVPFATVVPPAYVLVPESVTVFLFTDPPSIFNDPPPVKALL